MNRLTVALATAALLALLVTAACSDPAPTPPTEPTSTPWIITATPGATATPRKPKPTPRPTTSPTATPVGFIPPTPSGPGICGRTPEVQQAIIDKLKIPSCRVITEAELYRIRSLPDISAPELKAGDFAGLVNLDTLRVAVRPVDPESPPVLPAGLFAGSRIRHLGISAKANSDTHVTIEDGAFDGAHVDSLSISLAEGRPVYDRDGELTGYRAVGRLPDRLPEMLTELSVSGDLRRLDWTVFKTLPNLKTLTLEHDQARPEDPYATPTPVVITIPADAFDGNPRLQALELKRDSSWGSGQYRADAGMLAEHQHLASVVIQDLSIRGRQPDGLPLRVHPDSTAAAWIAERGTSHWADWTDGRDFRLP